MIIIKILDFRIMRDNFITNMNLYLKNIYICKMFTNLQEFERLGQIVLFLQDSFFNNLQKKFL